MTKEKTALSTKLKHLKNRVVSSYQRLLKTSSRHLQYFFLSVIRFLKHRRQAIINFLAAVYAVGSQSMAAVIVLIKTYLKKIFSSLIPAWRRIQTACLAIGKRLCQPITKKLSQATLLKKVTASYQQKRSAVSKILNIKLPWVKFTSRFKLRQWKKQLAGRIQRFISLVFAKNLRKLYLSLILTLIILGSSWFAYRYIFYDLPDPMDLTTRPPIMSTRILDRNGRLLYSVYLDENRTLVPLEEISQDMINATIAIEDRNFFNHQGFSVRGIFRAFYRNISGDQTEGGSTITQQLVKNRLLGSEKTLRRKIRELILAVLVEGTYSKQEILQMYLNEVPYGGSIYGVEEAARKLFDKSARDLTLSESALLAGLPVAPTAYSPFGPNPEFSARRQEEVLRRMVEDDYISIEEAYKASQDDFDLQPDLVSINGPHFVMYVRKLLAEKFGEAKVQQGGLEIRTSLDLSLQRQVQQIVSKQIEQVEHINITNGAALVTNPQTGEILAMVGSKDFFDFEQDGQVNVTIRPRQPGSAIKPLTYSAAFEQGKNPWDFVDDTPVTYQIPGSRPYSPRNYDNVFRGRVTLREALAASYNVPAVKILAEVGVDNLVAKGREMGITSWIDSSRFGLSLTLGAGEVLMTDLAKVFGTLATGGYTLELDPFIEVRDHTGQILYRNPCFSDPESCRQLSTLEPLAAYQITDILSDNQARTPTFGYYSLLNMDPHQVAVKTGTTNNMRDNWAMGYTTNRLVGVWVGNNDNSSMSRVASGLSGASPIWHETMALFLDQQQPHQFQLPDNIIRVNICAPTNTLPCKECPLVTEELFIEGEEPVNACGPQHFHVEEEQQAPIGERPQL